MNIIIDIVLLAILAISAFLAAKKGLIGTILSLLGTVIAIVLSVILSTPVSNFVDNTFVNPSVKKYILSVVDDSSVGKTYDEAIASIDVAARIEEMPTQLKDVIELAGIDTQNIIDKAQEAQDKAEQTKDDLINSIAKPISMAISRVASLVVLFVVLNIALWFVSKLLTAIFNMLPLAKTLNKFGGLAFGIVRGLLIVFVVGVLFSALTKTVDPESSSIFSKQTIDSTIVLKTTMRINPINSFLNIK